MITLKIDGKTVEVEKGATILAAAEKIGVRIPTLCFLKKVSPTGACRICVVDVAGADKPMTACNTPAEAGMEITTQSERLFAIRKQIVELLLVNHPLDCPVCDAAGECDLQNTCYAHGVTSQHFLADDVNPPVIDGWPLIQQVPNRCVLCEKCVKVCHETIGASSLFVNDKGDRAFIDKKLELCEFCGNCVSVCPTGTMISKPFKFKARCWELTKVASVCTSCGSQCQIDLNVKNGHVYRVTSEDGTTVNDGTLCFNGFFGFDYVHAPERLRAPQLRDGAGSRTVTWDEALAAAAAKLKGAGKGAVAGIAGSRLTNEEAFLFQRLFRDALGSANLDSEGRVGILRAYRALHARLGLKGGTSGLGRIGGADVVLVFGADPTAEAPAVDWLIQKAVRKRDGRLIVANPRKVKLDRYANVPLTYRPGSEAVLIAALARLVLERKPELACNELRAQLAGVDLERAAVVCGLSLDLLGEAADALAGARAAAVVFGGDLYRGVDGEEKVAALATLAQLCGALDGTAGGVFPVGAGGNSQGLFDMGVACDVLPGGNFTAAQGLDLAGILAAIEAGSVTTLYLAGANPLFFAESARWRAALQKLDCLIVQDLVAGELTELAHIVLPGVSFAEKSGTVTSSAHRISTLNPAIPPCGGARRDVEILSALIAAIAPQTLLAGESLAAEVARCSQQSVSSVPAPALLSLPTEEPATTTQLLAGRDLYRAALTNAHSPATREVASGGYLVVNPADARTWGLAEGSRAKVVSTVGSLEGPVCLCDEVPQGLVFAPYNCPDVNVQQILPTGSNLVAVTVGKA